MAILVTGSTGTIGARVLSHLQGRGLDVRALTRTPDKAQLPNGVTAVRGDLADIDSFRAALKGVSTLFLLVPNVADELTQALQALLEPGRVDIAAQQAAIGGLDERHVGQLHQIAVAGDWNERQRPRRR